MKKTIDKRFITLAGNGTSIGMGGRGGMLISPAFYPLKEIPKLYIPYIYNHTITRVIYVDPMNNKTIFDGDLIEFEERFFSGHEYTELQFETPESLIALIVGEAKNSGYVCCTYTGEIPKLHVNTADAYQRMLELQEKQHERLKSS